MASRNRPGRALSAAPDPSNPSDLTSGRTERRPEVADQCRHQFTHVDRLRIAGIVAGGGHHLIEFGGEPFDPEPASASLTTAGSSCRDSSSRRSWIAVGRLRN